MNALKTILWSIFVPGTATIVIPYLVLTFYGNEETSNISGERLLGLIPVIIGSVIYLRCAWDFIFTGDGTPAPFDPPKAIVVKGFYRFTRNPMYVAVVSVLIGESVIFWSPLLLGLAAIFFISFHFWVIFYEEPILRRSFGKDYGEYTKKVPRWFFKFSQ